jgi:hypothetical protein
MWAYAMWVYGMWVYGMWAYGMWVYAMWAYAIRPYAWGRGGEIRKHPRLVARVFSFGTKLKLFLIGKQFILPMEFGN